jgi:hypothetical protein
MPTQAQAYLYGRIYNVIGLAEGFSWTYQEFSDGYGDLRWYASNRDEYYLRVGENLALELPRDRMLVFEAMYIHIPRSSWVNSNIVRKTTIQYKNGLFAVSKPHSVSYGMKSGDAITKEFDGYESAFTFYKELTFENMVHDWAHLADANTIIRKCRK